ncbi:MAG: hypothetical protein ACP5R5_14185, partial [Armatimonadota bacterium]
MTDDKRLNLDEDLDKLTSSLLSDVKAATDEVKQRQAAARQAEQRSAAKAKSRKLSAILVGIGAIIVLLLSYWMVFARPEVTGADRATGGSSAQVQQPPSVAITCPRTAGSSAPAPSPSAGVTP